jgi:hypothetical protein
MGIQDPRLRELFCFCLPDRCQTIPPIHNENTAGGACANASTRVHNLYPSLLGALKKSGSWFDLNFDSIWQNSNLRHNAEALGKTLINPHSLKFSGFEKRIFGIDVLSREVSGLLLSCRLCEKSTMIYSLQRPITAPVKPGTSPTSCNTPLL